MNGSTRKLASENSFWNWVRTSPLLVEGIRQEILLDAGIYRQFQWTFVKNFPSVFGEEIAGHLVAIVDDEFESGLVLVQPLADAKFDNMSQMRQVFVKDSDLIASPDDAEAPTFDENSLLTALAVAYVDQALREVYVAMILEALGEAIADFTLLSLLIEALHADEAVAKRIVEDDAVNPHRLGYFLVKQHPEGTVAKTIAGEFVVIDDINPRTQEASVFLVKDFMAPGRVTKTVSLKDLTNKAA